MIRGLIFFLTILIFISCSSHTVTSYTSHEAGPQNDFYLGLLLTDDDEEKVNLFEKALVSSNINIRQAAAEQLAIMMQHGIELSDKTAELVRQEAAGWWAEAFSITLPAAGSNTLNRERILSFLLGFGQNTTESFNQARFYVLSECRRQGLSFSESETAAIEGHYADSGLRYNDALNFFRAFQVSGSWPQQLPQMFFEYPGLINVLGRAFQFTQSGNEGLNLFLRWETNLGNQFDDLRYRLVFFAARIARRIGNIQTQAVSLFERALTFAPDYEQQDACIWYILDMSLTGPINIIEERLARLVPLWHSGSYFNNIMERYLHRLVSAREWRRVVTGYDLIKDTTCITKSGFAWVIARSMEEDYLSAEDRRLAARTVNNDTAGASDFFQIAYDAGASLLMPALYYRMQSADALGLPFLIFSEEKVSCDCIEGAAPSSALQFLLGFFANDAESYALPYIRSLERSLTSCELRAVAQALDDAHMHPQSMRLITLYIFREGYVRERRDLEIMYPRPYHELIETHANYFDIAPPLFFGLVRTESAFQSAVVSRAGAVGLSQLMPATGREQAERIRRAGGPDFFGPDGALDSTDPSLNVYIGTFYLNHQRNSFGDMTLALMAYNGGHTRVRRWRAANNMPLDLFVETVPIFETRDYGRRVPAIGRIYEELYYR